MSWRRHCRCGAASPERSAGRHRALIPGTAAIRALLQGAGVAERVYLLGRRTRTEVAALLWHSDVLVLPSRREALGVAVLEGMAASLPVVASRAGGIPEILRPGVEGLLVEPEDAQVGGVAGGSSCRPRSASGDVRCGQASCPGVLRRGDDERTQGDLSLTRQVGITAQALRRIG